MLVGLAGVAITLAALPFSSVRMTPGRLLLIMALALTHLAACVAYYLFVEDNIADTSLYYFDRHRISTWSFSFGTVFVVKFTQIIKTYFGGSYLEFFLLYQSIGFWGIMILMRTFQEIQIKLNSPQHTLPLYLLFIPSMHFWTSGIGKDAPMFFAISLCVWSVLKFRTRLLTLLIALLVMVLVRPHVALITVIAFAVAAALHPRLAFGSKVALLGVALIGLSFLVYTVEGAFGDTVVLTSASSVRDFTASVGSGYDLGETSFPFRLISLLFRPFFFDATNLMALVASIENVGSVIIFAYLIKNWRSMRLLARQVFFIQFCLIFSVVLIMLLTLVYYNVGLGLRQRLMVFLTLLSLVVARWAMPRRRAEETPRRIPGDLLLRRRETERLMGASK